MTYRSGKISVFTPSFADENDSNAQNLTVKEVVSRLNQDRFRILMFCEGEPDPRIAGMKNVRFIRWHRHGNTIRSLAHGLANRPDIYFFPREGPLDAAYLKLRQLLGLKTRLITYIVSGGLYNGAPRPTMDRNVRQADAVYGNCQYLSELIRARWNVPAGTIYDGIDRRFFNSEPGERSSSKKLTVLFAGSLRPYKRPDLVIRNAARWPTVHFRIAGIGEEESSCRKLSSDLGCQNVQFLGHLSSAQLGEEMRRADVFLFPSVIEGHPQVLGQAAACGLPCVAMNIYRPEFVVHDRTGFLADSEEDLAGKLDVLLTNFNLRKSFSDAAADHSRLFDWDEVTRCWENAFEAVAAEGNVKCSKTHLTAQIGPR